jgi:hypothetical protein
VRTVRVIFRKVDDLLMCGVMYIHWETAVTNIIHTIHTLMKAHPEFDIFFADGINAFNCTVSALSRDLLP